MPSAAYAISTDFLDCNGRSLFVVNLQPEAHPVRGSVLFLHPFAEEMHKARRTVAMQARALATAGYAVMLLDLSGCGDSSGDFADASWAAWLDDASCAVDTLRSRHGASVTLWGLRLGALLACDLSQRLSGIDNLLMWQPVLNGEQHMDQFLRFELAGQALKGESGFDRAQLWGELRSGRSLQVAGYDLASGLALGVARVRLGDLAPVCPVLWLDVGRPPTLEPSVANGTVISRWRERGVPVHWRCIDGEAFWRDVDAPDSPVLITATVEALAGP